VRDREDEPTNNESRWVNRWPLAAGTLETIL